MGGESELTSRNARFRRVPPGRPRRSCLSVPGSESRKVEKALASAADEVVIDLEDSVAAGAKAIARDRLVATLSTQTSRDPHRIAVRVNAAGSPWCIQDVIAIAALERPPGTIILPKVESCGDVHFIDRLLDGVNPAAADTDRIGVQALIETATGLAHVVDIAFAGERLECLVLGYADLAASLGLTAAAEELAALWLPAQHAVLVAARAANLQVVDGPHLGVSDDTAFRAAVRRAGALGFDGKWAIHPAQVPALNEMLSPSLEEIQRARQVLATLEQAQEAKNEGVVSVDGRMVDEAVAVAARRVLVRSPEANQ